ncbi:MAG: DUF1553 domain-containing protein [Saprospiraceae bacterium]
MIRYLGLGCLGLLCALLACHDTVVSNELGDNRQLPDQVDYNFHIRPIFSDRCFACHGFDEKARKAELRLDDPEFAYKLLDNGRQVIFPGKIKESEVWHRIHSEDAEVMMPPPESNLALTEYEKALITKWIRQGAEYKKHWAFIPPQKQELAKVKEAEWAANEIDYFVLQGLEGTGLSHAEPESKGKLLRRLSFDLTGLPPSAADLADFLADDSPNAYEKQVDRLLASTAYGERMASTWLEAARYADSHGYQDDRPRTIWPWRDWVINAFNQNLSYKDFITWQLAGDLLPNATYEQKLATAFNRNHGITQEGGVVNEEYITEYVADRTNTVATAFMGLTMQCARCHDHKYDPISQKDYYEMFAFFNGIDEKGQINYFDQAPAPNMPVEDAKLEATIAWLDSLRSVKEAELLALEAKPSDAFSGWLKETYPTIDKSAQLDVGLLAHFKLDVFENLETPNEVKDGLLGKVNVKIINELVVPTMGEGKMGRAMQFDGKNYLSLGDVGDFEESNRFSFGAWVKPMVKPEKLVGLLGRRNGEQRRGGYELVMNPKGQLLGSLVHNQGAEKIVVQTKKAIPLKAWTHVFMTYNGSGKAAGIQLYINGERQALDVLSDELNRQSILNGNDFLVGNWTPRRANSGQYEGFSEGFIDEVRIYNRTLSAPEVSTLVGFEARYDYPLVLSDARKHQEVYQFYLQSFAPEYQSQKAILDSLRAIYLEVPNVMIMEEMETPRPTFVLNRGAYDAPGEQVQANTPARILPFPDEYPRNRLGLAQWLTHPDHPLTARIAINRFWQLFFGQGLVKTPEDFGNQGDLPSHPALLDWLAVTFMEENWDVKTMLKRIALSATYQQAARITKEKQRIDPSNVLLSRGPYQRLSAEMLRDQALAASGLLNDKVGGKWVKPYQPPGIWKELANQIGENKYRPSKGKDLYRRSLYSYWKRTIPPPVMLTFDASERAVCVLKRQSTSTPLQALILLNDPQFIEASRAMAQSVMQAQEGEAADWIKEVFLRLTSRHPQPAELDNLMELFAAERDHYEQQPDAATALLSVGSAPQATRISVPDVAALTVVTNVIVNLDEAKMKS